MGKTKHAKDDEFHKEIIRNLRKQLKRKDQEIRSLQKSLGYNQNKMNSIKEEIEEFSDPCTFCGKGEFREIILLGRSIKTCDQCHERTKARKL